jgi:hypothetical protein
LVNIPLITQFLIANAPYVKTKFAHELPNTDTHGWTPDSLLSLLSSQSSGTGSMHASRLFKIFHQWRHLFLTSSWA